MQLGYRRSIGPARTFPLTSSAMDEKAALQDSSSSRDSGPAVDGPKPSRSSWRTFALALCALVAGVWFFRPYSHCHHDARVLSIEDRVQNILTHTPLIGKERTDSG